MTAEIMKDIDSLYPEEQALVFSLVRSLKKRNENRTKAQIRFEEECQKYCDRDMSMAEIDRIIHGD